MTCRTWIIALTSALLAVSAIAVTADSAFSYVDQGDELPRLTLSRHPDGSAGYLAEDQVSVFAFVKPGHPRSREVLERIEELIPEFADRPVLWSLIVSDRSDPDSLAAISAACSTATLLVDVDDRLYGTIGVPLVPVVGISDASGRLLTYLPYRKVDYSRHIKAHILGALGDLDADGLTAMLASSGRIQDSDEAKSQRHLKIARMILKGGNAAKARLQIEDALALAPDSAPAYRLLADVLDALGETDAAAAARSRAAALDSLVTDGDAAH